MKQLIGNILVHAKGYDQDLRIENNNLKKIVSTYFVDDCEFYVNTPYGPDALVKVTIGKESNVSISYYGTEHPFPLGINKVGWTNDLLKSILHNVQKGVGGKPHQDANRFLSKFTNKPTQVDSHKTFFIDMSQCDENVTIKDDIIIESRNVNPEDLPNINSEDYKRCPRLDCGTALISSVDLVIDFFEMNNIEVVKLIKNCTDDKILWYVQDNKDNVWIKNNSDNFFFNINH